MSSALRSAIGPTGRLLLAGTLLGLALVGVLGGRISPIGVAALAPEMIKFLRGAGVVGLGLFAALQVVVTLSGAMPASLLAVAAGAIYGFVPGCALAAAGGLLGAVIAFGLSRSLFRSAIERVVSHHDRLRRLDGLVHHGGWKLVFLLRLSPIMPFAATSYLLGLSQISWADFLAGTLASLPAMSGYVFLGTITDAGLSAWTVGDSPVRWIMLELGGLTTLLLILQIGRIAMQRELSVPLIDHDGGCGE